MKDPSKDILQRLTRAEGEKIAALPKPRKPKDAPPHADHWAGPVLLERAAYLRKLARAGSGEASETLREFPGHAAMLSFRARDGVVELHENFADLFVVLDGRATLVTGGTVVGAETVGPGEIRGVSIDGGVTQQLRGGDVAHVPAGVPHLLQVRGDKTFTAFVLKIEQRALDGA